MYSVLLILDISMWLDSTDPLNMEKETGLYYGTYYYVVASKLLRTWPLSCFLFRCLPPVRPSVFGSCTVSGARCQVPGAMIPWSHFDSGVTGN